MALSRMSPGSPSTDRNGNTEPTIAAEAKAPTSMTPSTLSALRRSWASSRAQALLMEELVMKFSEGHLQCFLYTGNSSNAR